MKRVSLITLGSIGLAILACGGSEDVAPTPPPPPPPEPVTAEVPPPEPPPEPTPEVPAEDATAGALELVAVALAEPWSTMDLPINDGVVVASDQNMVLVAYTSGAISTYTASYAPSLEKAGYSKTDDYSTPEFTAYLYKKGSDEIGFAVGMEEGYTLVYMEDLDGIPEDQRVVKKGFTGVRRQQAVRRAPIHGGGGKIGKGKSKHN